MKKPLAFLLSLFTVMVMIFCVPMSDSNVEADVVLTPLQRKIQEVAAEMRGLTRPQLNSTYQASIPATSWCGYYVDLLLRESFLRLGYRNYSDYYPSGDMFGSVTVSRHVDNDHRFAERYCWCEWNYNNMYGHKTSNISSYVPRIGDIITIDTSNGNGNPDPDHVAIIVRTSGSSFVTSEGNTGSKQKLDSRTVKEYSYSYNSSGFYEGPCGRVVCCLRVFDPTGSVMSSSTLCNGEFYGCIALDDGRYVGTYNDNLQILDGNPANDPRLVFHFVPTGYEGEYVLFSESCGLVVDVMNDGKSEGENIGVYHCHSGAADNQRWIIYKSPSGCYLKSKSSGLVMACVDGNIQLSSLTGDFGQLFSICTLDNYVKPDPPKSTVVSVSNTCVGVGTDFTLSWEPVPITSNYDERKYCVDFFERDQFRYTYSFDSSVNCINGSFIEEGIFNIRVRSVNEKYKDYYSSSNVVSVEVVDGEIVYAEANVIDVPDFPITGPDDFTLEAVARNPIGDVKIVEPLTPMAIVTTAATPTSTPKPTATTKPKATVATTYKATATPEPKVTATPKPEVNEFVERLYGVALGRESDEEGSDYWVEQVKKSGMTGGDLAKNFLFSDEFLCKNVSDEAFVEALYKTFFDRESEVDGKAY